MAQLSPVFPRGKLSDVAIHKGGSLAVEDSGPPPTSATSASGSADVILCFAGIGDLRQSYRFLAPLLHAQGYRCLVADVRGIGESSAGFPSYTVEDLASDAGAILAHFYVQTPVVLVGNSLSGGAMLLYAARHPGRVRAVVCLDPLVRDSYKDKWAAWAAKALLVWPWGPIVWSKFIATVFKQRPPDDLASYLAALQANLSEPGRLPSVAQFLSASRAPCSQALAEVAAPVLLLYGAQSLHFANPLEEAHDVRAALALSKRAHWEVLGGAGHQPHVQDPGQVLQHMVAFLEEGNSD